MLNYFEIDFSKGKDESMSKKEKEKFLDRFYDSIDQMMIDDVFKKIRDTIDRNPKDNEDPMDLFSDNEGEDEYIDPNDNYNSPDPEEFLRGFDSPSNGDQLPNNGQIPDGKQVEAFIVWLKSLLYSGDHMVIVDGDGKNITNIKLIKMKGGKGK